MVNKNINKNKFVEGLFIGILLTLVLVISGYLVYDKVIKKENNQTSEQNNTTDKVIKKENNQTSEQNNTTVNSNIPGFDLNNYNFGLDGHGGDSAFFAYSSELPNKDLVTISNIVPADLAYIISNRFQKNGSACFAGEDTGVYYTYDEIKKIYEETFGTVDNFDNVINSEMYEKMKNNKYRVFDSCGAGVKNWDVQVKKIYEVEDTVYVNLIVNSLGILSNQKATNYTNENYRFVFKKGTNSYYFDRYEKIN